MENIKAIVDCIDNYLENSKEAYVAPPQANELLEKKGILDDRKERPGLPLRRLLKDNKIPHAYKEGQYWRIPHSKTKR